MTSLDVLEEKARLGEVAIISMKGERRVRYIHHRTQDLVMECLHTANYRRPAPEVGEHAFCFRCDTFREVTQNTDGQSIREKIVV